MREYLKAVNCGRLEKCMYLGSNFLSSEVTKRKAHIQDQRKKNTEAAEILASEWLFQWLSVGIKMLR